MEIEIQGLQYRWWQAGSSNLSSEKFCPSCMFFILVLLKYFLVYASILNLRLEVTGTGEDMNLQLIFSSFSYL